MQKTVKIEAEQLFHHQTNIEGDGVRNIGLLHFPSAKFAYAVNKTLDSIKQEIKVVEKGFKRASEELMLKRATMQEKTKYLIKSYVPTATEKDIQNGVSYDRAGEKSEEFKNKHEALKEEFKESLDEFSSLEAHNQKHLKDLGEIEVEIYAIRESDLPKDINGFQLRSILFMVE